MGWPANQKTEDPSLEVGNVFAYRGWHISIDGRLTSLHAKTEFEPRTKIYVAECNEIRFRKKSTYYPLDRKYLMDQYEKPAHKVPDVTCSCGFYAQKHRVKSYNDQCHIMGLVRLSGKVIEGKLGYRAEKLEIIGLFTHRAVRFQAKAIARDYGIEHLIPQWKLRFDNFEDMLTY